MAERLGPRACVVCTDVHGPRKVEGCWKCGSTIGHRHVVLVARTGKTLGRVAACGAHAPSGEAMQPNGAEPPSRAASELAMGSRGLKRRRDRERRQAQRLVLDRHADEVAQALAEIREARP